MLNVAICEDQECEARDAARRIAASPIDARITCMSTPAQLLESYVPGTWDLIVMDIFFSHEDTATEEPDGVEAVRRIRMLDPDVPVAFATSSADYALEAYRLGVSRYLEKPITQSSADEALKMAADAQQVMPGITLKFPEGVRRIPARRVMWCEQSSHSVAIHLSNGTTEELRVKLSDLADRLRETSGSRLFVHCHQSYLVNLAFVEGVDRTLGILKMNDGGIVHVRRSDITSVYHLWQQWGFQLAEARASSMA